MDSTEEQKMLEKPVKGYQLRELTNAVNDLKGDVNKKLTDIAASVTGVVTSTHLEERLKDLRKEVGLSMCDEIEKIHLEYAPTKKALWWLVAVAVSALVGQVILNVTGG